MSSANALAMECLPKDQARAMAHRELDQWFDSEFSSLFSDKISPTIEEMSELFQHTRQHFLGQIMKNLLESLNRDLLHQHKADCPKCTKVLNRKRFDKKVLSTLQGAFELSRPYFYCSSCHYGFHPADKTLDMAPERHQYDIQSNITKLSADLPYEHSSAHFSTLTGIAVSSHFSHYTLQAIGRSATLETVIPDRENIAKRIADAQKGKTWRPILVVSCDGAFAPIRPPGKRHDKRGAGEWKDVKGVRIYLAGDDDRIIHIASWHQQCAIEKFTEDLEFISKQIPQDDVRITLVGDGAIWLWNAMRKCFPKGREVLDYYHCSEYIHAVAIAQYGKTSKGHEWVEATMARLFANEANQVLTGLRRMRSNGTCAEEAIKTCIGYLEKRIDQLNYGSARRSGSPIGSGGIESANKFICHARLKRSGAWWLTENCNSMLRIRCANYNGNFNQVFDAYKKTQRNLRI